MDPLTEVTAVVRMLVDYMNVPPEDRETMSGAEYAAKAWQVVKDVLRKADPQAAKVVKGFEKDPDIFGEALAKYLRLQVQREGDTAAQLAELLSGFQRQSSRQRIFIAQQSATISGSGAIAAGGDIHVGGDVKGSVMGK